LGDDIVYTDKTRGELPTIKQLIDRYSELRDKIKEY